MGKIEKEQRLAEMQALRNHSRLKLLVSESDFERQVNVGEHGQNTSETEILQKWEAYQSAWSEFVRKYGKKESGISSSVGDDGKQEINFQDVPWPLMSRKGSEVGEELLLSLLHISGNDLHSLIQQERLRWHPDKFIQLFGSQLSNLHRDAVLLGVKTVSQLLNSLANELCSNTEESKC